MFADCFFDPFRFLYELLDFSMKWIQKESIFPEYYQNKL